MGRLYRLARRQENLLCDCKALEFGNQSAEPARNPAYMFISSRPADKVSNEVSIIAGYPFKSGADATLEVGPASFTLYTSRMARGSRPMRMSSA